jgi:hypothetical protein
MEQLDALAQTSGFPEIRFMGPFTERQIIGSPHLDSRKAVGIFTNPMLAELDFLEALPDLRELTLAACHCLTEFSTIGHLKLESLALRDMMVDQLDFLEDLVELRRLELNVPLPDGGDLRSLPSPPDLTSLTLGQEVFQDRDSLRGISRWQHLSNVDLTQNSPGPLGELAELPSLHVLALRGPVAYELPTLPSVASLHLEGPTYGAECRKLPAAFPGLYGLSIIRQPATSDIDLSPLADLPELKHVTIYGPCRLRGAEHLAPGILNHYY